MTTPLDLARDMDRAAFRVEFRRARTPSLYAAALGTITAIAAVVIVAAAVVGAMS